MRSGGDERQRVLAVVDDVELVGDPAVAERLEGEPDVARIVLDEKDVDLTGDRAHGSALYARSADRANNRCEES